MWGNRRTFLTLKKSGFCSRSVFMVLARFSQLKVMIYLHSINRLGSLGESRYVFCRIGTVFEIRGIIKINLKSGVIN